MGHDVCTECNHERCDSCQLWSRQVIGGRERSESASSSEGDGEEGVSSR